jgi:hypothetical protein
LSGVFQSNEALKREIEKCNSKGMDSKGME